MNKFNYAIGDFLKSLDVVREKVGKDLTLQKQRNVLKEEKGREKGEYDIVVLRKISFKKEKTSLSSKLSDIETLNKKVVRF